MARLSKFSENTASLVKPEQLAVKGKTIKAIHYTKLKDSGWQYCNEKDKEEIIFLAWLIDACKGILQPLLVRKIDVDEYEIIGGHKRRRAVKHLVEEEGKKQYEFVPCIVLDESDVISEFNVYASNGFHDKTDYEIMHELTHMKNLLENHPEEFPHLASGRMVDKLAAMMNMKRSTVGEYLQISKNLSDKGMEAFQAGELNKSAAVAISSLPHQEQDKLLDVGVTKQKDIKTYKEERLDKTIHRTTVTDGMSEATVLEVLPGQIKVVNTDMELAEEEDEEEPVQVSTAIPGRCICPNCMRPTQMKDTFSFFHKTYCMNCLYDLLVDLDETGIIKINRSEAGTKGNIIRG